MSRSRPRAPAWLFVVFLLASAPGLVAAAIISVAALRDDGGWPLGFVLAAGCSPIVVIALVVAGTLALRRGRFLLAGAAFAPPITLTLWVLAESDL